MTVDEGAVAIVTVVADPGLPSTVAESLAQGLPGLVAERMGGERSWRVSAICSRLAADEAGNVDYRALAGSDVVPHGTDVTVCLTDQPQRSGGLPVVADASAKSGAALISIPAIGALRVRRGTAELVVRAIGEIYLPPSRTVTGDGAGRPPPGDHLGPFRRSASHEGGGDVRYVGTGAHSRFRLLAGMVRANRPWRLVSGLSGAFAGAVATGGLVLVNQTVWKIAAAMTNPRLVGATILAIAAMVIWLIVDHSMWERTTGKRDQPVGLYNTTTVITLAIGVLFLYVGLVAAGLLAQAIVLASGPLSQTFRHSVQWSDRVRLVWLAASMATVGGALGSGFDSDDAVRLAAYGYRQRERRRKQDEAKAAGTEGGLPR